MQRVTYWNEEYQCWSYKCPSGDAAIILKEYEDLGGTPGEIGRELSQLREALAKSEKRYAETVNHFYGNAEPRLQRPGCV